MIETVTNCLKGCTVYILVLLSQAYGTPRNLIGKYLWILNTIIHGVESIIHLDSTTNVDFTRGIADYP